jgi:hypothetical protein
MSRSSCENTIWVNSFSHHKRHEEPAILEQLYGHYYWLRRCSFSTFDMGITNTITALNIPRTFIDMHDIDIYHEIKVPHTR